MKARRGLLAALGLSTALIAYGAGAEERGVMVVSPGAIGTPNAAVRLLDLGSVAHAGDDVTFSTAIVVLDSDAIPGLAYMLGHERLSCRDRTSQTTHVEVIGLGGDRVSEFEGTAPPEPVTPGSPLADVMNRACQNAPLTPPGVMPFADVASGVAAVRASVDAAGAVQSPLAPHRFVLAGIDRNNTEGPTPAFVDQAMIERDGDAVVRWVLLAYGRPRTDEGSPVAYDMAQMSFDCTARKARLRVAMAFGTDGTVVSSNVLLGPWVEVRPGTIVGAELATACGTAAPGAPTFDTTAGALEHARSLAGAQAL